MSSQDRMITCSDCAKEFLFTAGEQEFYQQRGFSNPPKRCEDCRSKRKAESRGPGGNGKRPQSGTARPSPEKRSFPAVCSRCNSKFDAPFEPKEGRPIFCRDCFDASRSASRAYRGR